jgi:hypothetical protein
LRPVGGARNDQVPVESANPPSIIGAANATFRSLDPAWADTTTPHGADPRHRVSFKTPCKN